MKVIRLLPVLFWVLSTSDAAYAHAVVVGASPAAHDKVSGEALSIEVRFNSRIDAARSTLKLFNREDAAVVLENLDASGEALKAKATHLSPGPYRLHWQTLSPDGHISQGDIPFDVVP